LKNLGTSTLVIKNLRIDVRYIRQGDQPDLYGAEDKKVGRLKFVNALFEKSEKKVSTTNEIKGPSQNQSRKEKHTKGKEDRGVPIIKINTFVQPGVDQTFTFGTAVPNSTSYILAWSSFEYEPRPSLLQRPILFLSRRLGLIQYSLRHITDPHTCERLFKVDAPNSRNMSAADQ
jgi:hypothetical protein